MPQRNHHLKMVKICQNKITFNSLIKQHATRFTKKKKKKKKRIRPFVAGLHVSLKDSFFLTDRFKNEFFYHGMFSISFDNKKN